MVQKDITMLKSSRNKIFKLLGGFLLILGGIQLSHAGPVTKITILGLSNTPTFTAGVATNTPTTTIFLNAATAPIF
jgi:hypothetical protein